MPVRSIRVKGQFTFRDGNGMRSRDFWKSAGMFSCLNIIITGYGHAEKA